MLLENYVRTLLLEDKWLNRSPDDELDGTINFQTLKGDLFNNVQSYIKNDIESYSLTKVESLKWSTLYSNPKRIFYIICHPERRAMGYEFGMKYVTFEIYSFPLTSGESEIEGDPDRGLTKHQIRNKLGSKRLNNEFSAQEFEFKCKTKDCSNFSIRVYREENSKGKSNILLEFV